MISITFEGGDGIKNPKLFTHDLIFNAEKVSTIGNVTITDGITSRLNSDNMVDSTVKNSNLYNRNNIEFQIKFTANGYNGYVFLVSIADKGDSIGLVPPYQGYISVGGDWHYFNMPKYSYDSNNWYYLIVNLNKGTHTFTMQFLDVNKNLLSSYTESRTSWFYNNNLTWRYGLGQEWGGYPSNGCYDLKETWIKDLDTDEILVPWFD